MTTFDYRPIVTVVDVLDSGACIDGVLDFVVAVKGIISDDPSKHPDNHYIQLAAGNWNWKVDGYGDGYGYGYGDGNAYGSGNGSGNWYGNGYGDGNGNGYGDGYGDGNGNGYGYGDGYGYGYGDGYGDGDGDWNGGMLLATLQQ